MRTCPECNKKLGLAEIFKYLFDKNNCIKCSNCSTDLTIRIKGISNGISVFFGILVGIYLGRLLNYTFGKLFSFILALTIALIVEILLMVVITSIIGFKKYE
ncbi:MAG: hypothetical protein E6623_14610 [Clostridium perfringens]|uniref:hypothetical protein n=1 Tax=Clostridium TaxID=1485 RepID=UPI00189C0A43|nr:MULTISPECIES: hypothetical protein [Clostridium]MDU6262824.1 hypothetical protein [Clostridium perfringens]MDY3361963.1 hypothetical protein [Clostridium celatum]MDB2126020.1 hypothetical protein [Clostridium paraputrificum]MDU6274132.1 hypothetical protein [Clostridium sp.]MDU6329512.1 hypothetical protein [Clostridium sp.]